MICRRCTKPIEDHRIFFEEPEFIHPDMVEGDFDPPMAGVYCPLEEQLVDA